MEKDILIDIKEKIKFANENNSNIYNNVKDNISFATAVQWDELVEKQRLAHNRPCLKINKTLLFINQIVNSLVKNIPYPKIRSDSNNQQSIFSAEVMDGLIRSIFADPDSQSALAHAIFCQVAGGVGYVRLITKYENDTSFNQIIKISKIEDPSQVILPYHLCKESDYTDMPYCAIENIVSKDVAEREYKERKGYTTEQRIFEDEMCLLEFFEKEIEKTKVFLCDDGQVYYKKDYEKLPDKPKILKEKEIDDITINWYLCSDNEIIEKKVFPGHYIPIIPLTALQVIVDRKKSFISITDLLKDPQRAYNYWVSAFTEAVALAPLAPYIADERQIANYKEIWENANKIPYPVLPYSTITENGVIIPPPQRQVNATFNTAFVHGIRLAADQFKETSGIWDASLGMQGNEVSGRAILARQKQGDNATFHFFNNIITSIKGISKILIDIIPIVYDTERQIILLNKDRTEKQIQINTNETTKLTNNNIRLAIDIGQSWETQRMETAQNILELANTMPQIMQPVIDLFFRSLDFPMAQEIADRLTKVIKMSYPDLIPEQEDNKEENEKQLAESLQKVMQLHQLTMQENSVLKQNIEILKQQLTEKERALQTQFDIAKLKSETALQKAQIERDAKLLAKRLEILKEFPTNTVETETQKTLKKE